MIRCFIGLAWISIAVLMTAPAFAATVHDESIDGDLSTNPLSPTLLAFDVGSNVVSGEIVTSADTRDYFTFSIGAGESLASVVLVDYFDVRGAPSGDTGFAGIIGGTTSFVPSTGTVSNFLGTNHVIPSQVGSDVLLALAGAPLGGTEFTAPLGPGDYTFLIQQTGPELTGYSLDFIVTPEPGTALLVGAGLLVLGRRAKR